MKVSVVIPAWGETPFLPYALKSVREQSYADVELVVCSPPPEGPQTALAARLEGVRQSCGEWILFVDADDWIEGNMVSELLYEADSSVDVVVSGLIRGSRTILWTEGDIWSCGPSDVFNCMCAKLFRRNLFDGFEADMSVVYGEDLMATAFLLHRADKIVNMQRAFYHYCVRPASLTHRLDGRRRVLDLMRVGDVLRTALPEPHFASFHDRITRDALLLWCRYRLLDQKIWKKLRKKMSTPLLADERHGLLKKGVLFCAHCLFD